MHLQPVHHQHGVRGYMLYADSLYLRVKIFILSWHFLGRKETKKGFSKKPILQLTAVEQFGVLLSLTDSYVFVHDLKLFREQGRLERTKGCSLYALDIQDRRDPLLDSHRSSDNSEKSAIELRMRLAVVVKRKILTFEWMHRDQEFREVQEFSLPDQPKVLSWASEYAHQPTSLNVHRGY